MIASAAERDLAALYDDLSRFQWRRAGRLARRSGRGLEMRKRLAESSAAGRPGAGTAPLSAWVLERALAAGSTQLLDVGCGFGALLMDATEHSPGLHGHGLTLSGFQVERARELAQLRGLGDRLEFRTESFDRFEAGPFDAAVSVESLFHAPDLERAVARISASLRPGGRLVWVEDMAQDGQVAATPEARLLLDRWDTERLHAEEAFTGAAASAGLRLLERVDLTDQVRVRSPERVARSARRLARLGGLVPARPAAAARARRVLHAFEGGVALEQLYAAGAMRYVAQVFERPNHP